MDSKVEALVKAAEEVSTKKASCWTLSCGGSDGLCAFERLRLALADLKGEQQEKPQTDWDARYRTMPPVKCECGLMDIPAAIDGVQWYWQRHSRTGCTLELPDNVCWCGLKRSEHLEGHKEGATPATPNPAPEPRDDDVCYCENSPNPKCKVCFPRPAPERVELTPFWAYPTAEVVRSDVSQKSVHEVYLKSEADSLIQSLRERVEELEKRAERGL